MIEDVDAVTISFPMKLRAIAWLVAISLALLRNASGQSFVNLDFEDATIVPDPSSSYYPYAVYATNAIPGWTVGGNFQGINDIFYNTISLGAPSVALFGTQPPIYGPGPLDGVFSIDLFNSASISQTATVPTNSASIQFIAQPPNPFLGGALLVSLGGQNITFSGISTGPNYTLYGGNIPSGLTGQMEQLTFAAASGDNNYWEIDDIQFSTLSVPEPSAFGLLALSGLFFGLRRSK
ncbi:MAG TPA: PEP-CTERM sorting domain-containing protein [Verrucomicrobiae bacterium]|nr:PEP-CTERM sorting domain-containing protein [Verrucomicrobiae bacterium]